jgi:hypothetical protein
MKKVKFMFIALAILLSIGGAFATRPCVDCRYAQQYYQVGGAYVPAGVEGINYICETSPASSCTFIQVGSNYQLCETGFYTRLQ